MQEQIYVVISSAEHQGSCPDLWKSKYHPSSGSWVEVWSNDPQDQPADSSFTWCLKPG